MKLFKIFRHNWLWIVYLNFRKLPFRQAVKFPIDVYGRIQLTSIKGNIIINGPIKKGMVKIGAQFDLFPMNPVVLDLNGSWIINGAFSMGTGGTIHIGSAGILETGNKSSFGANSFIYCDKNIAIGDCVDISWRCQVMDTDTHLINNINTLDIIPMEKDVRINSFVWIGNNTIINKGTSLPSNCIVASGSMCNKDYSSSGENVVFAGCPVRVVKAGFSRVWELKYKNTDGKKD